uniref:Peptidase S1 domain-containing protein n=1 Tax=Strix occidentalis caurina TaxID=311401 RepID=A0A8D0FDW1_STROC
VVAHTSPPRPPQRRRGPPAPRLPQLPGCGVPPARRPLASMRRIMGGSVAPRGAWPWLVSVRLHGELMCGGVLVGLSWVLTAAHCFAGLVEVGTPLTSLCMPQDPPLTPPISFQFNPKTFHGDLALLELAVPLAPSPTVSPVCLPSGHAEPSPGTTCYIAGWGSLYEEGPMADVVMEARVPLLSQETCRGALGRDLLTNAMFCAGYLSGGIDSCQVMLGAGGLPAPQLKNPSWHSTGSAVGVLAQTNARASPHPGRLRGPARMPGPLLAPLCPLWYHLVGRWLR